MASSKRILNRSAIFVFTTSLGGAAAFAGCHDGEPVDDGGGQELPPDTDGDSVESLHMRLRESDIVAVRAGDGIDVTLPVEFVDLAPELTVARVAIVGTEGVELAVGTKQFWPNTSGTVTVHVSAADGSFAVPAGTGEAAVLGGYVVSYSVQSAGETIRGRRSLWEAWPRYDITMWAPGSLNVDGATRVRLLARDESGHPLAETAVRIILRNEAGDTELFEGPTDANGMLTASLDVGDDALGDGELVAMIAVLHGDEEVGAPVEVVREERVMITTDKPVYQPGQRIHVRTLALSRPSLRPAAERDVTIEVSDALGNKVYREHGTTDEYGVTSLTIPLATQLNQGTWNIAAIVDGVRSERSVRVERYALPTFGVDVMPDRGYYGPGDTALIDLDARYFFGEPVSGATVLVEPYTFDVGFNALPAVETTMDDEGLARVEVPIPSFLVGQELNGGSAFVRVDVSVTDATGHTEQKTRNLIVSSQDVLASMVIGAAVVPGTDVPIYVLTRTPDNRPVAASVHLEFGGNATDIETDARGFAQVNVPFGAAADHEIVSLEAELEDGRRGTSEITLVPSTEGAVAVLTDRNVYQVGDSVEMEMWAPAEGSTRLFVDLIRDGQTLVTDAIDMDGGHASYTFDLSADLTGALQVEAYFVTVDGRIVRGSRLIYVDSEGALRINYTTDQPEYRPGDNAAVSIQVTDTDGEGVQAAVGLTVVDEAVFALQDQQPGFERVYFELEDELLDPAYNIYGWTIRDVVAAGETDEASRETAASVVLASTATDGYANAESSLRTARVLALQYSATLASAEFVRLRERMRTAIGDEVDTYEEFSQLSADADGLREALASAEEFDPWGRRIGVAVVQPYPGYSQVVLTSSGMDEVSGTDDDNTSTFDAWSLQPDDVQAPWFDDGASGGGDWGAADAGGGPWPGPDPDEGGEPTDEDGEGGGGDNPRVRQFFPETLYVDPDIITDENGDYSFTMPIADSITTWRMTGIASSADGRLGSSTAGVRVFQPFFVNIDLPVALTMNDRVEVPVGLFNYLDEPQTVELRLDEEASGDWYELDGPSSYTVELQPNEVTVRYFPIRALKVGRHPLQVTAIGTEQSDAIRRVVAIEPDGQAQEINIGGRFDADVTQTVTIPEEAIDDANTLLLRVYPGLFSQVVDGLDSLFAMPSGCFEQTSSTTYPNILALRYLRATDQISPEIEMRATEYIAQGYQALVSYEVPGGGFEWFGNTPAHRILTAYGLLEFSDMSEVFEIDPAIIPRTQQWLVSQQEADGRFRAAPEGIHEGATNNFQDSDVRATAYITYALAESGYTGPELSAAFSWLDANSDDIDDAYTLGMLANAYIARDDSSTRGIEILAELDDLKEVEETEGGTLIHWSSASQSLYYGDGDAMTMETTALILQAFIRAGMAPSTVEGGINYLVSNKDTFGNWSSTQATILSLRAFIELLERSVSPIDATVRVYAGDTLVDTLEIDETNSDITRQVDLSALVAEGDNEITLEFDGTGSAMYQIVGAWYLPWASVDEPSSEVLSVDVSYDRTTLALDEQVGVSVEVTNNTDARQDMIMLELGVPPGFDVVMSDLVDGDTSVIDGVSRVERIGRRVVLYLYGLDAHETLSFDYHLRATMVVEAQTPASVAYLYYDSDTRSESRPVALVVTE